MAKYKWTTKYNAITSQIQVDVYKKNFIWWELYTIFFASDEYNVSLEIRGIISKDKTYYA